MDASGALPVRALSHEERKVDVEISDWLMPQAGGAEIVGTACQLHPAADLRRAVASPGPA